MRPRSRTCSRLPAVAALLALPWAVAPAQQFGFSAASVEPSPGVRISEPGSVQVAVGIRIRRGYHINSNRPNEPYLIPTSLSWNQPPFRVVSIEYPPAEEVRYDFSEEPLSVYSSRIEIVTTFLVEGAPESLSELRGSFRFQACNDNSCLPPKTIPVTVPVRQ